MLSCVLLSAIALTIGPTQPDFSGRWTLESPVPATDAVRGLVVDQPITRTNVQGEPMPPAFLLITIRRERSTGTSEETHQIGVVGGTVGGVAGKAGASRSSTTRFETKWIDATLVFTTSTFDGNEPRTGDWSERRESWSLAPAGRLRIEIVNESRDQPKETRVFLYRRQ